MILKNVFKAALISMISAPFLSAIPAMASVSENLLELTKQYRYEGFEYEVNEKLGRARLSIKLVDKNSGPEESGAMTRPVLVDGLRYDQDRQEIIFERDGTYAVCATVTPKRFLFARYLKIKETGNCTVTGQERVVRWDDGLETGERKMTDLVFNAR
jgi:hypothetical protein